MGERAEPAAQPVLRERPHPHGAQAGHAGGPAADRPRLQQGAGQGRWNIGQGNQSLNNLCTYKFFHFWWGGS